MQSKKTAFQYALAAGIMACSTVPGFIHLESFITGAAVFFGIIAIIYAMPDNPKN